MGLLAACSDLDATCLDGLGTASFRYTGPAYGEGTLKVVSANDHGRVQVDLSLEMPSDQSAPEAVRMQADGSCDAGQIQVQFGGAEVSEDARLRILGVELLGTLPRGGRDGYGVWSAEVSERRGDDEWLPRQIGGFWRTKTDVAVRPVADSTP